MIFGNQSQNNQSGPINLSKGEKISLTKDNPNLKKLRVGLGWDIQRYDGQADFDLDASAFLVDANGRCSGLENFVFYKHLATSNQSVVHTGDNRTGEGDGDDEAILIDLTKIPNDIQKIIISVTIDQAQQRGQKFGQVSNAYVRVLNEDSNSEILRYDLNEDYDRETALVICEIYKHNSEWKFNAVGSGYHDGLAGICRQVGLDVC